MGSLEHCATCGGELPAGLSTADCPTCLLSEVIKDREPGPTEAFRADDVSGQMIGHYKLLQKIGEGGFGSVYMADQQKPVKRRVALKIIKLGMDTKQVVARFEAERQALALMDHPNIARVLDAGSTRNGRPYFVMELVKGIPINDYCDSKKLTTRARLKIFIDVCHAVQHAHQKGIIHRDLKPTNVLVASHGDQAEPKVIDFGIAKATLQPLTEKTLFTNLELLLGSPSYMSPEQVQQQGHDVDTRSDIYSLGVMLYEILTGTRPFDLQNEGRSNIEDIRRIICDVDPPRPSVRLVPIEDKELAKLAASRRTEPGKLRSLLKNDLDWIIMKALEKDRSRRYDTADALALDLQRFLDDEPVSAAAPSLFYRVQKYGRRHRLGVTTASIAIGLLVIHGIVGNWIAVRALHHRRIAEADLKESQLNLAKSLETQKQSIEYVIAFFNFLSSHDDAEFLNQIIPVLAQHLEKQPDSLMMSFFRSRLLIIQGQVASIENNFSQAESHFKESVRVARELVSQDPNEVEYPLQLSSGLNRLGELYMKDHDQRQGDISRARAPFEESVRILKSAMDRDRLGPWLYSIALEHLGLLELRVSNFDRVDDLLNESLEIRRSIQSNEPKNARNCWYMNQSYSHLAALYRAQAKEHGPTANEGSARRTELYKEAAHAYELAATQMEEAIALDPTEVRWHLDYGRRLSQRADVLVLLNQTEMARQQLEASLQARKSTVEKFSNQAAPLSDLSDAYYRLSDIAASAEEKLAFLREEWETLQKINDRFDSMDHRRAQRFQTLGSKFTPSPQSPN